MERNRTTIITALLLAALARGCSVFIETQVCMRLSCYTSAQEDKLRVGNPDQNVLTFLICIFPAASCGIEDPVGVDSGDFIDFDEEGDKILGKCCVVLYEDDWLVDCCGVVTGWTFESFADGEIELQVWKIIDGAARKAEMVGFNTMISEQGLVELEVTDPAEQIPVDTGYAIGFLTKENTDIIFHLTNFGLAAPGFLQHEIIGKIIPDDYGVGKTMVFDDNGDSLGDDKAWAFGEAPTTNLPDTVTPDGAATVGTVIFTVTWADVNTKQTLTASLKSSDPVGTKFAFDDTNGEVTVNEDISAAPYDHELTFEISDGCLTTTAVLTINVIAPAAAGEADTVTPDGADSSSSSDVAFWETTVGAVVIGLCVALVVIALLLLVGFFLLCHQMKKPVVSPEAGGSQGNKKTNSREDPYKKDHNRKKRRSNSIDRKSRRHSTSSSDFTPPGTPSPTPRYNPNERAAREARKNYRKGFKDALSDKPPQPSNPAPYILPMPAQPAAVPASAPQQFAPPPYNMYAPPMAPHARNPAINPYW
ncbi:hypothetical protein CAPTEDRAFT_212673 [Capitella teleta]|uniref:Cadherin domain-containing protein n=1 Tax=Capitella teleta TaxID=283909 RepID=R7VCH5_CAPTE|nr:hypothetical protein CAPTEDRAFT_212673 [Capitella teleta]|eukprot:ELU14016.1 hypothetical protein CAPTEDRAFT_212673 [Capitella teleta]